MKLFFILLLFPHIVFAQVPISEARKLRSGRTVTVNGIVTATFGELGFVQDTSGGMAIYKADVTVSDSISITGKLSKYNGMLEIVADSVMNFGHGASVVAQHVGIGNLHEHEGELVHLNNVSLTPRGHFFYPQREGTIIQENDSVHYWIDDDTDIPGYTIPGKTNVTGIVGRFGDNIQILPRSHADISTSSIVVPESNQYLKVVNWNIEFFGAPGYGPANDLLQVENVAEVLNTLQPDIVALQEVSNDNAFRSLVAKLPLYEGRCSSRYSYSFDDNNDFPPQKLCFIYRPSIVQPVREKILFRKLFDSNPSDMFSSGRLPYLLEFNVAGCPLTVINYHGKSGASESDWSRRLSDAQILKDTLDNFYKDNNVILLGDFNDDLDQSIVSGHVSPFENFVHDINYLPVSKLLSENNWPSTINYNDMIDHQVISSSLSDRHVSTRILNPFYIIPFYARTTSDHVPVVSEFDMREIVMATMESHRQAVYPNPTNDNIWFPDRSNVTVINCLGEIVIKEQSAHPPISLGECAPGIYLVMLEDQVFRVIRN